MANHSPDILQYVIAIRGYVVVHSKTIRAIGELILVHAQSKRCLIEMRYLRVGAVTDRSDYKAQNAILLERFNKQLWPLPARLHFYRVVPQSLFGDVLETESERTVRTWTAAVEDIKRKKRHGIQLVK